MDLIFAIATRPFAVAIGLMLALALIEIVLLLVGGGLSDAIDNLLPDPDPLDADGAAGWLSFFGVGRAPLLVILIAFLTTFGLSGYVIQAIASGIGSYLPAVLAVIPAFIIAVFGTGRFARAIGRVLPSVESSAVSSSTFVGRIAMVTLGEARIDRPTEARLKDRHGQTHYVLVEPEHAGDALRDGDAVLLVGQRRNIFTAVPAPAEMLAGRDDLG